MVKPYIITMKIIDAIFKNTISLNSELLTKYAVCSYETRQFGVTNAAVLSEGSFR